MAVYITWVVVGVMDDGWVTVRTFCRVPTSHVIMTNHRNHLFPALQSTTNCEHRSRLAKLPFKLFTSFQFQLARVSMAASRIGAERSHNQYKRAAGTLTTSKTAKMQTICWYREGHASPSRAGRRLMLY